MKLDLPRLRALEAALRDRDFIDADEALDLIGPLIEEVKWRDFWLRWALNMLDLEGHPEQAERIAAARALLEAESAAVEEVTG